MSEVHRREFLQKAAVTGVAVGGATWAVPSILGFDQAFALTSGQTAVVTSGTAVASTPGGNTLTVTAPAGSQRYVLVMVDDKGNLTPPTLAGWTLLTSYTTSFMFAVYTSATNSATISFNNSNDKWTAQIFGVTRSPTAVSSVSAGSVVNGTAGSVPSAGAVAGASANAVFLLAAGSSTAGATPTVTGYGTVSNAAIAPDVYLAKSTAAGVAPAAPAFSLGGAAGNVAAVQIALN